MTQNSFRILRATQVSISGLFGLSGVTDQPCMLHNHLTARSPKKVFLFFWVRELWEVQIFKRYFSTFEHVDLKRILTSGVFLLRRSFFREFRDFFNILYPVDRLRIFLQNLLSPNQKLIMLPNVWIKNTRRKVFTEILRSIRF